MKLVSGTMMICTSIILMVLMYLFDKINGGNTTAIIYTTIGILFFTGVTFIWHDIKSMLINFLKRVSNYWCEDYKE